MLQSIRDNSQGIIAKVIVGLIAVTFALFGVESLVSLTAGSNAPATVNGEEIGERELMQAVELQRRQLLSQMGENADPALLEDDQIRASVLEGLVEQSVLVQSAQNQNMRISEQLIDQLIVTTNEFQVEGKFDRAQFEAMLRNAGLSPLMYRDILRKERLLEQERFGYLLSSFALPSEVDKIVELDRQQRDVSYYTLPIAPHLKNVEVSDEQVREAYEAQKQQLTTEEMVVVDYLLLDRDSMKSDVAVDDDEVQSAYQTMLSNFQAKEARGAAHILVEITPELDEAAAEAKASEIAARLKAGEDFAAVAKDASDDIGSAEMGGDLGVNPKGVLGDVFDDALFTLAEVGDVSEPVRTEFGYHLIKLTDVQQQEAPAFAEVEAQLREELTAAKTNELFVERLKELEDITFSAGDLSEPAEVMAMEIQTSKPVSRNGGQDEITSNPRVVKAAFSDDVLKEQLNSAVIELDSGRVVVLHLNEHLPPRTRDFNEVADQLRTMLKAEAAEAELKKEADAVLAKLASGKDIISVSGVSELIQRVGVQRGDRQLPQEVAIELFAMPHPVDGKPVHKAVQLFDGSVAIVALNKVTPGSAADLAEQERNAMNNILSSRSGQDIWRSVVESKKAQAEIERL